MLTTDCNTGLSIKSGRSCPTEAVALEVPGTWDVILLRHDKLTNSSYFLPLGARSGSSCARRQWYFEVSFSTDSGLVEVMPQDPAEAEAAAFLVEVLNVAASEGLYIVPLDCPMPGPSPQPAPQPIPLTEEHRDS